jgi:putative endonuclease
MHQVYILYSQEIDNFYIGSSFNVETRKAFHNAKKGAFYTKRASDWEVYFTIDCKSKRQSLLIERHIKKMKSVVYIRNLKIYPEMTERLLLRFDESGC